LAHLGGGKLFNPYDDDFFTWWEFQVQFIDDYPYTRIDLSKYPDVIIPPGDELQGIGNIYFVLLDYIFYIHKEGTKTCLFGEIHNINMFVSNIQI
jgi:hypothetical protein